MKLTVYRHLWGLTPTATEAEERIEEIADELVAKGYGGVESVLPSPANRGRFAEALRSRSLPYAAQILTEGTTPGEHFDSLRTQLEAAAGLNPRFVVVHGGRDTFEPGEAVAFYRDCVKLEQDSGIPLAHETHRSRILFAPWTTRSILEAVEEVRLCVDFSHWVCVCERLLGDVEDSILLAASRARHLHARVGFEQGPQVPDPRAPEYARHLAAHETWWDWVWEAQRKNGFSESTLTPEFGPPLYQHTMPHSRKPLADLPEICDWMADRQRNRFSQQQG